MAQPKRPRFFCPLHLKPVLVEPGDEGWYGGTRIADETPVGTPVGLCDDCQDCFQNDGARRLIAERVARGENWLMVSIPETDLREFEKGYRTLCQCHFKKFGGKFSLAIAYLRTPSGEEAFFAGCQGPCQQIFVQVFPLTGSSPPSYAAEMSGAQFRYDGFRPGKFGWSSPRVMLGQPIPQPPQPLLGAQPGDRVRALRRQHGFPDRDGTLWGNPHHVSCPLVIWDKAPDDLGMIYLDVPVLLKAGTRKVSNP